MSPVNHGVAVMVDYLFRLGCRARRERKPQEKKWPGHQDFTWVFFARGLFAVSLEGLSERETTRGLLSLWQHDNTGSYRGLTRGVCVYVTLVNF